MRLYVSGCIYLLIIFCIISSSVYAQSDVLTQHNDIGRTGWYNHETILNTKNVKAGTFGKLFTRAVDDQIYAQPLVMLHVNLPGIGKKNVVFVATVNNSVYAFDADSAGVANPYWQVNLSAPGARPPKNSDMTGACGGAYQDFSGNIGIVGTPVIDSSTNTLFAVARSIDNSGNFMQYLHAIDIITGAEKAGSPKLITAQIQAYGTDNVNGVITFNPQHENQRGGLLLLNGNIYIMYASHCDWWPYHGWILGYDETTLQQTRTYNTTPDGGLGGIWMSGAAPSADESGNIYVAVGNGSVGYNGDPANQINRSESALKLTPSGNSFTLKSFFSPTNIADLEAADLDFGVTQMLLIPGTNRVMTACKDGHLYLMNRDTMGGFNATSNNVVQVIDLGVNAHLRSAMTYYKGPLHEWVYSWSENALLKAFPYNRTTNQFDLNNTVSSGVQGPVGNNGALLSVSSNGSIDSTAVLWASFASNGDANQSVRPGVLHAFDANDVTKELWNSSQYQSDNPGNYAKFNCPTIINGKVYLATFSNSLVVYGLTGKSVDNCNTPNIALNKTAFSSSAENTQNAALYAFDGNSNTSWTSQYSDPQWIAIDLGKRYDLCNIVLKWGAALGRDFKIQLSDDFTNWSTYITITYNTATENYLPVNASGRYVRMYGTARGGTRYGYTLNEFEVYGTESTSACAPPSGLSVVNIYENTATLGWNSNGSHSSNVQYKTVSAGNWTTIEADTNFLTLNGLACATDYLFQIQGKCNTSRTSDYSASSAFSTLSCDVNCSPLPTRWTTQDIGDIGVAGSACYSNGIFTLNGSGDDIWNTADAFRYSYTTNLGDIEIKARVVTMDQSNEWNKCGIMIRESLATGSRHAFIAITSGNGAAFQNRIATDGESANTNTTGIQAPYWIKLVKTGSVYKAYASADNILWAQIGDSVDAGFGANTIPVYAGLAITSHDNNALSVATVDNYQLTSGSLPLQIMSFTASLTLNQTVNLQWITSLENNIKSFVIERSSDNINFTDLSSVDAEGIGSGSPETYDYEDKNPLQGINYYRLRIVSNDGSISHSAVATILFNGNSTPSLAPNPASKIATILQGKETIRFVNLYDISGRLIYRISNTNNSTKITIPVNNLANSVYVVEMRTPTTVYRKKLLVHN